METDTTTWSEFPNEEIAIVEQVLASNTTNSFIFLVNLILIYIYTFLWGGSLITSCYDDLFRDEPKIIKNVIDNDNNNIIIIIIIIITTTTSSTAAVNPWYLKEEVAD